MFNPFWKTVTLLKHDRIAICSNRVTYFTNCKQRLYKLLFTLTFSGKTKSTILFLTNLTHRAETPVHNSTGKQLFKRR